MASTSLLVAALCAALSGCLTVEFTDDGGGAGGGAAGGGGEASGAGGSGGSGGECPTTCTEDHRCGNDGCDGLCGGVDITAPLAVELPDVLEHFVVWQETQSAFVASDLNVLRRIDLCTGEVMVSRVLEDGGKIRGVELDGEDLVVAIGLTMPTASARVHRLDPRTLEPKSAPIEVANVVLWDATLGTNGLWVNNAFLDGETGLDGPALVKADGMTCRAPLHEVASTRRGSVAYGDDLIFTTTVTSGDPPTITWHAMKLECSDCLCGEEVPSNALPGGFEAYSMASGDGRYALIGYTVDGSGVQMGTVAELDPVTMIFQTPRSLDPHPAGSPKTVDGFLHGAIFGVDLYAVGAQGESSPLVADGESWIARFDLTQPGATEGTIPGGTEAFRVFADETGVYVAGRRDVAPAEHGGPEAAEGFFVRCTHELQCPRVGRELPTVSCNGAPCEDGEVCCWDNSDAAAHQCSVGGVCPDQFAALACNGPDDCGGDECCLSSSTPPYSFAQCKQDCGIFEPELCFGYPGVCDAGGCGPLNGAGDGWQYCN